MMEGVWYAGGVRVGGGWLRREGSTSGEEGEEGVHPRVGERGGDTKTVLLKRDQSVISHSS